MLVLIRVVTIRPSVSERETVPGKSVINKFNASRKNVTRTRARARARSSNQDHCVLVVCRVSGVSARNYHLMPIAISFFSPPMKYRIRVGCLPLPSRALARDNKVQLISTKSTSVCRSLVDRDQGNPLIKQIRRTISPSDPSHPRAPRNYIVAGPR